MATALALFPWPSLLAGCNVGGSFNVVQYGYTTNDDPKLITANKDPEAYWLQNCADGSATYLEPGFGIGNLDPNTQMPANDSTQPASVN